jgi:hypothetical protein
MLSYTPVHVAELLSHCGSWELLKRKRNLHQIIQVLKLTFFKLPSKPTLKVFASSMWCSILLSTNFIHVTFNKTLWSLKHISIRYNAVPNTNLLFVWAFCMDKLCTCDEPEYNLDMIVNQILDPCSESDENYNPASHCTKDLDRVRQTDSSRAEKQLLSFGIFLLLWFVVLLWEFHSEAS